MDANAAQFCGTMCLKASSMGYICHTHIHEYNKSRCYEFVALDGHSIKGEYKYDAKDALYSACLAFSQSKNDTKSEPSN